MASPTQPPPPLTSLEWVKQQVGAAEVQVPYTLPGGVEVFRVPGSASDRSAAGYVVVGGVGKPVLSGAAAVQAVAKVVPDPSTLATICVLLSSPDATVFAAATSDAERKAGVAPPAIANGALDFWEQSSGALLHLHVDLASGDIKQTAR